MMYDPLTNLPNRKMLLEYLKVKINEHTNINFVMGILFLDLDDFKTINDVAGHNIGDKVLKEVAARIKTNSREDDLVVRFGGDEFIIILPKLKDIKSAEKVAVNILHSLSHPICIGDECWYVTASIGISIFPNDGATAQKLLKHADVAMYSAKQAGKNSIHYFNKDLKRNLDRKYNMIEEVKYAIENDNFAIELQPQYNLKNDEIVGVEIFLRWIHPLKGKVLPNEFLPYIQNTNFINHLGDIILNKAIMLSQELKEIGLNNIQIAINIEARQLINDYLIKKLNNLKRKGVDLSPLTIEIDESSFLSNFSSAKKRLLNLKKLGVTICLDNVGYGTSSLMPIISLPIDILKFDNKMAFDNEKDEALKKIIIYAAHILNKKVIAKRIDNTKELQKLIEYGCDYGQGYCFERMVTTSNIYNIINKIKIA